MAFVLLNGCDRQRNNAVKRGDRSHGFLLDDGRMVHTIHNYAVPIDAGSLIESVRRSGAHRFYL